MNLLFVTEYFPSTGEGNISGGVEARCFYLAKELSRKHNVKVICSWKKGEKRKQRIGNVEVERVGPHHKYSNKAGFVSRMRFAIAAYKKVKEQQSIDLVDGYNFTTYIAAHMGARKIKARSVATYHETWVGEWIRNKGLITGIAGEILERITLMLKFDLIIPVSEFTRKRLERRLPKRNMKVIYNGVQVDNYRKVKSTKAKKFRLVSVSRLVSTKRIDILLQAVKELERENIECVIIGDGKEKDGLIELSEKLGISKIVSFKGFIKSKKNVIKEIKKAYVFCMTSALEGFGITAIEGMASGIPVICSDIEPLKEVTENGKSGLLFRLDNYKDLASKIKILKDSRKKYEQYRKAGLKRAGEFDWKNIAEKYSKEVLKAPD